MKYSLGALIVLFSIFQGFAGKVRYDYHKNVNLKIETPEQFEFIENLKSHSRFGFLHNIERDNNIVVSPKDLLRLSPYLRSVNITTEILVDDIQKLIDEEEDKTRAAGTNFTWDRYHTYDSIQKFIDGIIEDHKDVVTPFVIGKSYEGREIRGIKISYKDGNSGIFIESNIHAREWITSATSTFFINELLTSENPEVRDIAENVDWYIIPVFNVDGFVYSHEKDRMWRKTRQPNENPNCPGADPNRNFDTHWNNNAGSSNYSCAETFRGPFAFSEPECKALADFVQGIKDKIGVYLAYHSYGQYILSPYGHSETEFPTNYDDMLAIAKASYDAILDQGYGTRYSYGSTASALYIASGSSVDYAYNELGIKMGFTFEFRDQGKYGFVLPSIYILPNCQETVAAMIALVRKSKNLGYL